MSARPGLCGGHQATDVPTAITNDDSFRFGIAGDQIVFFPWPARTILSISN
jgi:hypothetical protein